MGCGRVRRSTAAVGMLVLVGLVVAGCGTSATSTGSPTGKPAAARAITSALVGIPQHGEMLGSETAPVQATLYGDLECPSCRTFVLWKAFSELIDRQVRAGALSIVYRSYCTETCSSGAGPAPTTTPLGTNRTGAAFTSPIVASATGPPGLRTFEMQQVAAYAAGRQDRFWEFAMLFLHEQRKSGTGYVTEAFLDRIARETPGLNYRRWTADRRSRLLAQQVTSDGTTAVAHGIAGTPTLVLRGPGGARTPNTTNASYRTLLAAFRAVR
jgi:protein-disulfide isomerase